MRIFWNKLLKIASVSGDLPLNPHLPPAAGGSTYFRLLLQLCRVHF